MKRLDFHVHFNSADPGQIDRFAAECRRRSTIAALSGGPRYGGHDYIPNEQVLAFCRQHSDCMLPLAKLDLWDQTDIAQVQRYVEAGFRGFKCIYPYYEYDHDLYMPIYEAVEKSGLPMLFHTGNFRPSPADIVYRRPVLRNMEPVCLDRIARSFQKLHLVMAHLGTTVWRHEAAEYIKIHKNLYADLAGSGSWKALSAAELASLMKPWLPGGTPAYANFAKLVYGSDAYIDHPHLIGETQDCYDALLADNEIPAEIRKAVMGKTVAGWIGIQLDD